LVKSEALDGEDLNGDGDANDEVVLLEDRITGQVLPIGMGGAPGVGVVRIHDPPFSFPPLALERDVVAFLESEVAQGFQDQNQNGNVADSILRVFRLSGGAVELTASANPLAVSAAPRLNGRSIVISNGRVFFRTPEDGSARQRTERASVAADGTGPEAGSFSGQPSLSADGRFVAFSSNACNLVPLTGCGHSQVYAHDRQTGSTKLLSAAPDGTPGNEDSSTPALSTDARFVAFTSNATNLVGDDTNDRSDVFVFDQVSGAIQRVSIGSDGHEGDNDSFGPSISADGRYVAFTSVATNLIPGDTNGALDVFIRDRDADANGTFDEPGAGKTSIIRVSVGSDGTEGHGESFGPAMSADGRLIAFTSSADNLTADDTNAVPDVLVHDQGTGVTVRVSVSTEGAQANDVSGSATISADGRFVAFSSRASNLVPGDTTGSPTFSFMIAARVLPLARVSNRTAPRLTIGPISPLSLTMAVL